MSIDKTHQKATSRTFKRPLVPHPPELSNIIPMGPPYILGRDLATLNFFQFLK